MRNIYTHLSIDLDAAGSLWIVTRFILNNHEEVEICFVPANWDGTGMKPGDIAVDIEAGGKGLKGESNGDGVIHSCFASLVQEHCSLKDQEALAVLVSFIDSQDTYGSAVRFLAPEINDTAREVLGLTGINSVLRAFQATSRGDDFVVFEKMSEVFDGMLKAGRARLRAEAEAKRVAEVLPGGKVAIVTGAREYGTNHVLFEQGIKVIVYVDGNNLGLVRRGTGVSMDHEAIRKIVINCGEENEWFAHETGYLFCRGSRKAPRETPSRVNPRELAGVAASLFESDESAVAVA